MSFTLIDDQDSSVSYKGTWVVGGTAHEYKSTVASSVTVGDTFTVPFTGTSIGVYGTTDSSSNGVRTSYAIDGNTPVVVATTGAGAADAYHQLFWQSGKLTDADHKLVVTMRAVNAGQGAGEGTIWFDFFNATAAATTTSVTPLPSNTVGGSASKSVAPASQTKSKAASTSSASPSSTDVPIVVPSKSTSHAGLVAGLIVAFIALLTLAGAYYWYRRRRHLPRTGTAAPPPPMTPMGALPTSTESAYPPQIPPSYGISGVVSLGVTGASFGQGYAPLGSRSPSEYSLPLDPPRTQSQSQSAFSVSSAPTSTRGPLSVANPSPPSDHYYSDSIADLKRRQQEVVQSYEDGINSGGAGPSLIQHVDSGARSLPMEDEHPASGPIELPPVYTPN
ncbi:hypothetical protein FB45DRAFT_1003995 [Roridomyces roridus]|uniref:Uncharacterized protein n=1 Tax=Roridomyces roridus TaxID=1738132 RepID=A0AAD7FJS8_9AGAR|nr:hypothetical protein FB45DRAFT_1003995 [Roridomyces roridus]